MASTDNVFAPGPLISQTEMVVSAALTGIAWFNGAELLATIFLSSQHRHDAYFYCLLVSILGILVNQLATFMFVFTTHHNMYGILAAIFLGWGAMVIGQSLVLWSRLHLVCMGTWKLHLTLCMIIVNGICMHTPEAIISFLAVDNNSINPQRKSIETIEKISLAIFSTQEIILSLMFIAGAVQIIKDTRATTQEMCDRGRVQWLVVANVALITITVMTIVLESLAAWVVWVSFKGLGYSLKLKIEFAVFRHLKREAISPSEIESPYASNPTADQPEFRWYGSFAWPRKPSQARVELGEAIRGRQDEKAAANPREQILCIENFGSVQESPLGGQDCNGLNSGHARYFAEVPLPP